MSNQVALITGGATGIGKAVALKLVAKGVTVVMSGRRAEVGQAAVAEVSVAARDGAQVRFVQNDIADEAAVKTSSVRFISRRQVAMPMLMRVPEDSWVSTI